MRPRLEPVFARHYSDLPPEAPQQAVEELAKEKFTLLKPYISASVKVKESHARNTPLISLDPRHKVTQEFVELYKKLSRKRRKKA